MEKLSGNLVCMSVLPPETDDDNAASRDKGQVLLIVLVVLAIGASITTMVTGNVSVLKLGMLAALWAAAIGAVLTYRYRNELGKQREMHEAELYQVQLEFDAEQSARELEMEQRITERTAAAAAESAATLAEIKEQLEQLRAQLEDLRGYSLEEPTMIRAEARRIREIETTINPQPSRFASDFKESPITATSISSTGEMPIVGPAVGYVPEPTPVKHYSEFPVGARITPPAPEPRPEPRREPEPEPIPQPEPIIAPHLPPRFEPTVEPKPAAPAETQDLEFSVPQFRDLYGSMGSTPTAPSTPTTSAAPAASVSPASAADTGGRRRKPEEEPASTRSFESHGSHRKPDTPQADEADTPRRRRRRDENSASVSVADLLKRQH